MQAILIFFFHFVNYLTRMKNILHHGIVLHPKAQGKQQLCLAAPPRPRAQKRDASKEASLLISSFYETEIA